MAQQIPNLSKTKLLKLLYLMEEYCVKKYHVPFLGIPYEVWQAGPVAKEVFIDLSEKPIILKGYVNAVTSEKGTYVIPIAEFSDDEFSDNEMEVMDYIIGRFGGKTATELVKYTHRPGSLWHNTAKENNLLNAFNEHTMNCSDIRIDFSKALTDCAAELYQEQMEFLQLKKAYKKDGNI
ncbi:Panacea domain-containing protein [Bacteroides sp.]